MKQKSRNLRQLENIPDKLKALPQWVCFKAVPRDGHWGKEIYSPTTGGFAKSNEPTTWTDFQSAIRYAQEKGMDGLCFVLTSGIVFVDIDDIEERSEEVQKKMTELSMSLNTYCETSVSGKGLHFLCYGKLPENARKKNDALGLEMYDTKRFVCMTGNVVGDMREIRDLSGIIEDLNRQYLGFPIEPVSLSRRPATQSDTDLIAMIRDSRQGMKFDRLYHGDWQTLYDSQSSADFALVRILTFWTRDERQIDSIFRSSGLYRPKWDKCGGYYGKRTIEQALKLPQASMEM